MNKANLKQKLSNFFALSRRKQILLGVFLILFSIILFASMLSYFDTWRIDQSELNNFFDPSSKSENIGKKFGALISHFLIYKMFGISSFIFSFLFFVSGITYFVGASSKKLIDKWFWGLYSMILISVFISFNFENKLLGGSIGYEVVDYTIAFFGRIGVISFLTFGFSYLFVVYFNLKPENIYYNLKKYLFINRKKKISLMMKIRLRIT